MQNFCKQESKADFDNTRFKLLMAVKIVMVVFWVVMLCGILPPYAVKKVSFLCSVSFP
jgi:hypothetical protein